MADENMEIETFDEPTLETDDFDTFEEPNTEDKEEKDSDEVSQVEQMGDDEGEEGDEDDSDDSEEDDSDESTDSSDSSDDDGDDDLHTVKVDGQEEKVSLQELKNAYSGKKAVEKRFTEFNREKRRHEREFQKKEENFSQVQRELVGHLDKITSILDDPRVNPLEALYYLVDLKGGNTVEYEKRMMSNLENVFNDFSEMDEVERELYWARKQNDFLTRRKESTNSRSEQEQANRNSQAQLENLWKTHNVAEDDYFDAVDELLEMGYKKEQIEPEKVVNYIKLKPIYEKSDAMASQFIDDLGEDTAKELSEKIATAMQNFPNLSEDDLIIMSAKELGIEVEVEDEDVEELSRKVIHKQKPSNGKRRKREDYIDMF